MTNLYLIIDEYGNPRQATKLDSGDWAQLRDGYIMIYRINVETRKFEFAVREDEWQACQSWTNTNDVDPTKD